MNLHTERLLHTIMRDLLSKKMMWLTLSIVISVALLTVGLLLPKKYSSYTSIVVENKTIVGPLLEGAAEQTDATDQAAIVRELAFSRRALEHILSVGGWSDSDPDPKEAERLMQELVERTRISRQGANLIGIEYTDIDPLRAYRVAQAYVDWVIDESRSVKREESRQAFDFIDEQANQYHKKLLAAEEGLRNYRSANFDALPESAQEVTNRATALRREIESLQLELSEVQAREKILEEQITGEAEITNAIGQETVYRKRINQLQSELDSLRLNYHDTYPDIVRIKAQIADLEALIAEGGSHVVTANADGSSDSDLAVNPLYDELRSLLAASKTRKTTLRARIGEMSNMLAQEIERSRRIGDAELKLGELTRDYEVNRDIYQDLLRRRERARLSMILDEQEQGLTMKLQEPPAVPQAPTGLRFLHVAFAGLFLAFCTPIGICAAMVQLDPRVRMKEQIEALKLPVIAVVPEMERKGQSRFGWVSKMRVAIALSVLLGVYALAAWLRVSGIL